MQEDQTPAAEAVRQERGQTGGKRQNRRIRSIQGQLDAGTITEQEVRTVTYFDKYTVVPHPQHPNGILCSPSEQAKAKAQAIAPPPVAVPKPVLPRPAGLPPTGGIRPLGPPPPAAAVPKSEAPRVPAVIGSKANSGWAPSITSVAFAQERIKAESAEAKGTATGEVACDPSVIAGRKRRYTNAGATSKANLTPKSRAEFSLSQAEDLKAVLQGQNWAVAKAARSVPGILGTSASSTCFR